MRNRFCRAFVALVTLAALLLPAAGAGAALPAAHPAVRDSFEGYFIFEARGNTIPASQALDAVDSWMQKLAPDKSVSVQILRESRPLSADALLATGDLVSAAAEGGTPSTCGVVVRGDVLGTGTAGISQLTMLAKMLRHGSVSPLQSAAADLDGSGAIGISDLVRAAAYLSRPDPGGYVFISGPQGTAEAPAPDDGQIADQFVLSDVPAYSGEPYAVVHDNVPFFPVVGNSAQSWENYSAFDDLGRCGPASACIGLDIMPTDAREPIGEVRPSGWQSAKYPDVVPGGYLYNRCHLIGFQLAAENANPRNLITGTRYLNVQGMLPFENMVADYVKETGNHVLYRSTPVFDGSDLVARGVLLEASSVEDSGEDILFCVFVYNVQPGINIDYSTGASCLSGDSAAGPEENAAYVLSISTHKFHLPACSAVSRLKPENRQIFTGTRQEVLAMGYEPCGICRP